jgi:hypothetical protein
MAVSWQDIVGSVKGYFRLGLTGVRLKNSSGHLAVRNPGDSADAEVTASKINISGNVLEINSDAVGSGADWKLTLQRPAGGMTAAVTLTLPPDDGSPDQVLKTDGNGVLSWVSAGTTASSSKLDSTALAFGDTSPIAMFSTGAGDIVAAIEVVIDTAFNGTPSLSVGIAGTVSKYAGTTDLDLTQPAATSFIIHPNLPAQGAESLIATFVAGGASAGAARIITHFATPS